MNYLNFKRIKKIKKFIIKLARKIVFIYSPLFFVLQSILLFVMRFRYVRLIARRLLTSNPALRNKVAAYYLVIVIKNQKNQNFYQRLLLKWLGFVSKKRSPRLVLELLYFSYKWFFNQTSKFNISPKYKIYAELRLMLNKRKLVLKKNKRLKLAYISPFPPVRSGIAEYSNDILPELSKYYDIDLIVDATVMQKIKGAYSWNIKDENYLIKNRFKYDRVIYHFGNSKYHCYMLKLIKRIPGIVVLHDFYLSNLLYEENHSFYLDFYKMYGYRALYQYFNVSDQRVMWEYPCNLLLLEQAIGVVVHSRHSVSLANQWLKYENKAFDWDVIPLLRKEQSNQLDRRLAKKQLGFEESDILVCSFGFISVTKLIKKLVKAWVTYPFLRKNNNIYLILVGEASNDPYSEEIKKLTNNSNIKITGWQNTQKFQQYLVAADIAVQLRTLSRGETSAAVLECMSYGIATIVNAHGSMQELPKDTVWMLNDFFSSEELQIAIEALIKDAQLRDVIGATAQHFINKHHNISTCAYQYWSIIERTYANNTQNWFLAAKEIVKTTNKHLNAKVLLTLATNILDNQQKISKDKQILLDISFMLKNEGSIAAESFLKSLLQFLIEHAPSGYRVEPIYIIPNEFNYKYAKYARNFMLRFIKASDYLLIDEFVNYYAGDIYVSLLSSLKVNRVQEKFVERLLASGVVVKYVDEAVKLDKHLAEKFKENFSGIIVKNDVAHHDNTNQLFLDVSVLVRIDDHTGIQRTVRNLILSLEAIIPKNYILRLVCADKERPGYFYVKYNKEFDLLKLAVTNNMISFHNKDIFLGLDLALEYTRIQKNLLRFMRQSGVLVKFIVYDILPIQMKNYFFAEMAVVFNEWIKIVVQSDEAICISEAVKNDLNEWIKANDVTTSSHFKVSSFLLGADIENMHFSKGIPENAKEILSSIKSKKTFLMVNTIEPRKGCLQTLEAFELLWQENIDVNLVIVGRKGWLVEKIIDKLLSHIELNKRLFWLQDVSDEYLNKIYSASACLIVASEGEGFGLPLIEAAKQKLPIIARDLPVFKEIAGHSVYYFSGLSPHELSASIQDWLELYAKNLVPQSGDIKFLTWKESAKQLAKIIFCHQNPYNINTDTRVILGGGGEN